MDSTRLFFAVVFLTGGVSGAGKYTNTLMYKAGVKDDLNMECIFILAIINVFVIYIHGVTEDDSWSFDGETGPGPEDWAFRGYPVCGSTSKAQSPIDIPVDTVYDETLTNFELHGYDTLVSDDLELVNTGTRVEIDIKESSEGKTYFTGGGFQNKYAARELHFHWGINDTDQAGHTIHGYKYPLELHIVSFKEVNGSLVTPTESDDVALLVFLFELSESDNEALNPYINALQNVMYKGEKASFGTTFSHFMGKTTEYYRYHGSMGYPPCTEIVQWTLFKDTSTVSSAQLAKLRQLYRTERGATEQHRITFNHRPLQNIAGRKVKRNFPTGSVSSVMASVGIVIFSMLSSLVL